MILPRSNRNIKKRVSLDEQSHPTLLSPKTQTFQTDSLVKSDGTKRQPISNFETTLSERTEAMNVRHIVNNDITRNNVDPIKPTNRRHSIDAMVAQHWQDEIEFIPQNYTKRIVNCLFHSMMMSYSISQHQMSAMSLNRPHLMKI